jgi:hypothetical protein
VLTSILTTPKPVDRGGRRGRLHDCGRYGQLTVGQIAKRAGVTVEAVRFRINSGWTGDALCLKYRVEHQRKPGSECRHPTMATAVRLARAFPDRVPTTKEIIAVRPMSRVSASRWRQAFRDAQGLSA